MVVGGDSNWGSEHTIKYIGDVLNDCIPETYIISLINVISNKFNKNFEKNTEIKKCIRFSIQKLINNIGETDYIRMGIAT